MICQLATCDVGFPRTGLGLPPYTIITHSVKSGAGLVRLGPGPQEVLRRSCSSAPLHGFFSSADELTIQTELNRRSEKYEGQLSACGITEAIITTSRDRERFFDFDEDNAAPVPMSSKMRKREKTRGGDQEPPTSLPLPQITREDLRLDGYLEHPHAAKTLHLQTSMSSPRFEPSSYGTAGNVADHYTRWATLSMYIAGVPITVPNSENIS
ncbi:hypothetical protein TNCV_2156681 [Trichonephila clavipes]|nr:hypothetical protein TNCV_2156681 [Trichonephila clavipes]